MDAELAMPLDDATAWRLVREEGGHVILIMDTFGVVRFATPNVQALLGHSVDGIVGQCIVDLSPTEDLDRIADGHENVLQGGGIVLARQRLRTGTGRWAWVETTSRLVVDDNGRWIVCAVRREPGAPGQAAWSPDH